MEAKRRTAEKAVEYIEEGMIVGLGTGSTAYRAIQKLGERVNEGLKIKAVASSIQSENLAKELKIPLTTFADIEYIDVTIDGADEVSKDSNLIKGGGGALLREKILAYNSKKFIVIVDETKLVNDLGRFPLPVEVTPFAIDLTLRHIEALHCTASIRLANDQPYRTDNGNFIIDCRFNQIPDPRLLNNQLHDIPGVVETGLFFNNMVYGVIVGYNDGTVKELYKGFKN